MDAVDFLELVGSFPLEECGDDDNTNSFGMTVRTLKTWNSVVEYSRSWCFRRGGKGQDGKFKRQPPVKVLAGGPSPLKEFNQRYKKHLQTNKFIGQATLVIAGDLYLRKLDFIYNPAGRLKPLTLYNWVEHSGQWLKERFTDDLMGAAFHWKENHPEITFMVLALSPQGQPQAAKIGGSPYYFQNLFNQYGQYLQEKGLGSYQPRDKDFHVENRPEFILIRDYEQLWREAEKTDSLRTLAANWEPYEGLKKQTNWIDREADPYLQRMRAMAIPAQADVVPAWDERQWMTATNEELQERLDKTLEHTVMVGRRLMAVLESQIDYDDMFLKQHKAGLAKFRHLEKTKVPDNLVLGIFHNDIIKEVLPLVFGAKPGGLGGHGTEQTFILPDGRKILLRRYHWFDHENRMGGLGAVDLVAYLLGLPRERTFEAVKVISEKVNPASAMVSWAFYLNRVILPRRLAKTLEQPYSLPVNDPQSWPAAKSILSNQWGVKDSVLEKYYQGGQIISRKETVFFPSDGRQSVFWLILGPRPQDCRWLGPGPLAKPYLLDGHNGQTVITADPLKALIAKGSYGHSQVIAVGIETWPGLVRPYLGNRKIIFAPDKLETIWALEKLLCDALCSHDENGNYYQWPTGSLTGLETEAEVRDWIKKEKEKVLQSKAGV
ncbi:MAG: hypothetical protein LBT47_00665 [Deltaproteobacteria bacterium]|jgi:hypothetical protein|nr:hypothetical protein [Deltaproteobacteria bacterium]